MAVLTDEQKRIVEQAINAGLSFTEAARRAGCVRETAKSFMRRRGLASPKALLWEQNRQLALEGKRICPQCGELKILADFRLVDGRVKYSYCHECCRLNDEKRVATTILRFQRIVAQA